MPWRPRKCCGKKVRLTPANMTKNWACAPRSPKVVPVMAENQNVTPAKMAKTAPIEST